MIAGQRVAAIIVGRGGSKGLPGKNLAPLRGKPLIAWSVEAAQAAHSVDVVAVSSDDPEILEAARNAGCATLIRRPYEFATDTASVHDALIHALDELDWADGFIVLLQATSPLRTAADIDSCVKICAAAGAPSAVTVSAVAKPPQWMFKIGANRKLEPLIDDYGAFRRQDTEPVYALNGAVYVAQTGWYRQTKTFMDSESVASIMPAERSVDIDSEMDFLLAKALADQSINR
ncbi:MAG: acylneuraminate cytidylyltransferase family protein [Planctomycetaceae bacterium]